MIRFGPSGIPLSCKGRTLRDGIEDVHNLGLSAMEVQLVRVNVLERPAGEEEVGQTPRSLPGELVVEIRRQEDKKDLRIPDLGAAVVATFLGLYGELGPKEAVARIQANVKSLRDQYRALKLGVKLGLETSGRKEVVGSLDEIMALCKTVKGVVPVLNFAHVHAREGGTLRRPEDFAAALDRVEKAAPVGHVHTHFTGVEHEGGSELRYTPIKKGDLRFEPLAECLLDNDYDLTLVSSSPLLHHH